MEVRPSLDEHLIDSFFVRLGPKGEGDIDYVYLQPHFQPATQDYWCHVTVGRLESNLDLYLVHIAGSDDSSYSKHYLDQESLWKDVECILDEGVLSDGQEGIAAMGFFFTN